MPLSRADVTALYERYKRGEISLEAVKAIAKGSGVSDTGQAIKTGAGIAKGFIPPMIRAAVLSGSSNPEKREEGYNILRSAGRGGMALLNRALSTNLGEKYGPTMPINTPLGTATSDDELLAGTMGLVGAGIVGGAARAFRRVRGVEKAVVTAATKPRVRIPVEKMAEASGVTLPGAADDVVRETTEALGLKQAETRGLRAARGMTEIEPQASVSAAAQQQAGRSLDPQKLVDEVLDTPRALSAPEQASLGEAITRLDDAWEAAERKVGEAQQAGAPEEIAHLRAESSRLRSQVDAYTEALDVSGGTEVGRSLAIRRNAIERGTYNITGLQRRAAAIKGAPLTDTELDHFRALGMHYDSAPPGIDKQIAKGSADRALSGLQAPPGKIAATNDFLRTVKATADLVGTPFRQLILPGILRPIKLTKATARGFAAVFSERQWHKYDIALRSQDSQAARDLGKLELLDLDAPVREGKNEFFRSLRAEKIPIFGRIVRGSNRGFTTSVNQMRGAMYDEIIPYANKFTGDPKYTEVLRQWGKVTNTGTGAGDVDEYGAAVEKFSKVFFAPRYALSRFQALQMPFKKSITTRRIKVPGKKGTVKVNVPMDPVVRRKAMADVVALGGLMGTMYAVGKLNGMDIGTDPKSGDFLKLKVGNTRYDPLGGFGQIVRLGVRSAMTVSGNEKKNPIELMLDFIGYKAAPVLTVGSELLTGKSLVGEERDLLSSSTKRSLEDKIRGIAPGAKWAREIPDQLSPRLETMLRSVTPMIGEDIWDALERSKDLRDASGVIPSALLGIGATTYEKRSKTPPGDSFGPANNFGR